MADYANWLTKAQAATAIGVSTKGVERFEKAGRLQKATRPAKGSPDVVVYHPDDVARLAKERRPGSAPFVLPADGDLPSNGNGAHGDSALARVAPAAGEDGLVRALFAAAVEQVLSQTSQTPRLFLTLAEAAAESHLPAHELRRLIRAKTLVPVCGRGAKTWRIRRRDLEQL